jgi:RNA polymerase primary sigma factor
MNATVHIIARASEGRLLTADEEVTLGRLARDGDTDARDLLVARNTRLAWDVAYRYRGRGLDVEDIYQEALIGLLRALKTWNPDRGQRFSTYATWWVRRYAQLGIENAGSTIRLPSHLHKRIYRLRYAAAQMFAQLGRKPTLAELAEYLGCSVAHVARIITALRISTAPQSLSERLRGRDNDATFGDRIACAVAEAAYAATEERLDLHAALALLPPRDADMVRRYYGFGSDAEPMTHQTLGRRYNITREHVCHIINAALRRLKPLLDSEKEA